jgi:hypothetical protein
VVKVGFEVEMRELCIALKDRNNIEEKNKKKR